MEQSNFNKDEQILRELQKLNQRIDRISLSNRFFVFNGSLPKFAFFNFLAGTFSSLGAIFGTLIIASFLVYLFSKLNFTSALSSWISETLVKVNWSKIVAPQIQNIQETIVQQSLLR